VNKSPSPAEVLSTELRIAEARCDGVAGAAAASIVAFGVGYGCELRFSPPVVVLLLAAALNSFQWHAANCNRREKRQALDRHTSGTLPL